MILGRNAKRIGDILIKIPDEVSAKKAFAEARDYYGKALASEKDPEVIKLINQEMAEVP
jgi:predicted negative regulator of RcsB-dependent stress response